MEDWKIKKIEQIKQEISELTNNENKLKKELKILTEDERKYEVLQELISIYTQLESKYYHLEITSPEDHKSDKNNALKSRIDCYSQSLEILTTKEQTKTKELPFEYFLKLAQLQYKYFDNNREKIIQEQKDKQKGSKIFSGSTSVPQINEIIININKARDNVEKVIQEKRKTLDFETLFIYFEILGDLHIHIYTLLNENDIIAFPSIPYIDYAYACYEESLRYKSKIELPAISLLGIGTVNLPFIDSYFKFFKGITPNFNDVKAKLNFLYNKFSNHLAKKIKSYCWRTGKYCEYKKDAIFTINEGNGVFISMNYNNSKNFQILKYIEKILNRFNLKPILKQNRLKTPSWTKEICCTIYNNKFTIVFLDKYSPNVVLELGIAFGMGRKSIILINKNRKKENVEDQLFSMVNDYDCIMYSNSQELFEKLIISINGIFFNIIDYEIPNISDIFTQEDINELDKLIKETD